MLPLTIHPNGRYLQTADGKPFFWLGDTAWELFHRLTLEEIRLYFHTRKQQGFNVIQAVALAESDGLRTPNAYGRCPLKKNQDGMFDPTLPDTDPDHSYWDHVEDVLALAGEMGLYIALLPTWGDKISICDGTGPEIFTPENSAFFGGWIARRFGRHPNLVWVMGGDRRPETPLHFQCINNMASAIKASDPMRHLITMHPNGEASSSQFFPGAPWLDFHMIQSSHGRLHMPNYQMLEADYTRSPVKPVLDAEPRYEDIPINYDPANGYFDDWDVRQAAYWAVFSGAFGHTYGHHAVWKMNREGSESCPLTWTEALHRPGGMQMRHLKRLMESKPFFERIPDQTLVSRQFSGANHIAATRGRDYAMLYSPCGLPISVHCGILDGSALHATWFDPKTGATEPIGCLENKDIHTFIPAKKGRGHDMVLLLESAR